MARQRVRANSGEQTQPAASWTEDDARDLLRQGYSPKRVAERTGFELAWVLAQPVPRKSLLDRVQRRGNEWG